MFFNGPRLGRLLAALATSLTLFHGSLEAQADGSSPWRSIFRLIAEVEYDDNAFLLKDSKKNNVTNPSGAEQLSGRYANMSSASDVILLPQLEAGFRGPGMGGRDLDILGEFGYEYNLQNTARKHADLALVLQQDLAHGGRLKLDAGFQTTGFQKNYLTDAVDGNGDGDITPDERVYEPARVNRMDVSLGYRHRLMKGSKRRMGLIAQLKGFYSRKGFDSRFPGRTLTGPGGEVELAAEFGRRWTVSTSYAYERQNATATSEVVLLDETAFGQDLNGDGVQALNALTTQLVDRTRREQTLGARLEGELGETTVLSFGFSRRARHFLSTGAYDVANNGRDDTLLEFSGGLQVEINPRMKLRLAVVHGNQKTDRAGDPGAAADVTDYARNQISSALQYRF